MIVDRPGFRVYREAGEVRIAAAAATLDDIEDAHGRIEAEQVPKMRREGTHLVVACDATANVGAVLMELSKRGHRIGYGEAVAFNEFLMDAVEAGHRQGLYLGALAWPSVLTNANGDLFLLGFGLDESTRPDATARGGSVAPEVVLGFAPSAASDVFVLHAFVRTLLPFAVLPDAYRAALTAAGRHSEVSRKLIEMSQKLLAPDPLMRADSIAALREHYREVRPLVPGMPEADTEAMRRSLAIGVRALEPKTVLRIDTHQRGVSIEGGTSDGDASDGDAKVTFDLSRRALLWRLLTRLVRAHIERLPVSADELVGAGWPDEVIQVHSARTRLYTAIRDLRRAGLGEHLRSRDGGYFLDPDVEIEQL